MGENISKSSIFWAFTILNSYDSTSKRQPNLKKKKQDQRTWIDISPKKDTQMANKQVKRCSSLIIKEMQIRAIGRYFFMPTIL